MNRQPSGSPATGATSGIHPASFFFLTLLSALFFSHMAIGRADDAATTAGSLQRAREQWQPVSADEVDTRLQAVRDALVRVDRFFRSQQQQAAGWRSFVRWEQLEEELKAATPNPGVLRLSSRLLTAAAPLTAPDQSFLDAARALDTAAIAVACSRTTPDQFRAQLTRLDGILTELADETGDGGKEAQHRDVLTVAAEVFQWFDQRGYGAAMRPLRESHLKPNLFLEVSEDLLRSAVVTREVRQAPVRDVILGTTYVGTSTTNSMADLELLPDSDGIATRYTYTGQVQIRSNGYNQGATVRSASVSSFRGEKLLVWNTKGITASPATATARNRSRILDVSTSRVLGNRVARNRAYQRKSATEREVEQRTAATVRQQMDAYVGDVLRSSRDSFVRQVRIPLLARDAFPDFVSMNSTEQRARLALRLANSGQLSATSAPPNLGADLSQADAVCRIHESLLNNLADSYLAGRRLREIEIGEFIGELSGSIPAGFQPQQDQASWTISFDKVQPCVIKFDADCLTFEIRATDMFVDQTAYPGAVIQAQYQLDSQASGLAGKRSPRLSVDVREARDETRQLGVRQQVFRSMVRRRFDSILPVELNWQHIDLPDTWPEDRRLKISAVHVTDGWLTIIANQQLADAP